MESWLLALVLKPFFALVFFLLAYFIALAIWKLMPDSKLKRILFSPLPGHRGKGDRWR